MIYLLPSADYELYLGRLFLAEEEVLIHPTERLLNLYEEMGIRMTLFCDVACIWRYRQWGREAFAKGMEQQMIQALRRGHDIQAHLHPHWLYTHEDRGGFRFPQESYLLGTLSPDEEICAQQMEKLLQKGRDYLNELLQPHDPGYQCMAFRAGGYGLQPREGRILASLVKTGFVMDSSIIPGFQFTSAMQRVDFSHTPALPNYWLDGTGGVETPSKEGQGLFEIPIASWHVPPAKRWQVHFPEALTQSLRLAMTNQRDLQPRGGACNQGAVVQTNRIKQAYWRGRAIMETSFHRLEAGISPRLLTATLEGYLSSFPSWKKDIYLAMNSHPKGMNRLHFNALKDFHQHLTRHRGSDYRFLTFRQAWEHQRQERDCATHCS